MAKTRAAIADVGGLGGVLSDLADAHGGVRALAAKLRIPRSRLYEWRNGARREVSRKYWERIWKLVRRHIPKDPGIVERFFRALPPPPPQSPVQRAPSPVIWGDTVVPLKDAEVGRLEIIVRRNKDKVGAFIERWPLQSGVFYSVKFDRLSEPFMKHLSRITGVGYQCTGRFWRLIDLP